MDTRPFRGAKGLIFGLNFHLWSFFECANSKCSDEPAHMRSLARAFAGRLRDNYQNLVNWFIFPIFDTMIFDIGWDQILK